MATWSAAIKGGKYIFVNPITRGVGGAVAHPQQTLRGAGTALKSAAVGAGVGYLGWQAIVNDKPVARAVGDALIGSDNVDAMVGATSATVDTLQGTARGVKESVGAVNRTVDQANGIFGGLSDFLRNVCGGNGAGMFGSFFSNIGRGNVSGLSILGLLAAGLMIFGRFGWLGKIGGALLAMMLIGSNSRVYEQSKTLSEPKVQEPEPRVVRGR